MTRILVVEDEQFLAETWCFLLQERRKFDCQIALSAEEAQAFLEYQDFDLIVCDIRLPGMSGLDFKRWLNQQKNRTPLIFLTAFSSIDIAVIGKNLGAVSFLRKPISFDEFVAAVDQAIEYSRVVKPLPLNLAPVARLELIFSNAYKTIKELSEDCVIGRNPEAGIRLYDSAASREHAILQKLYLPNGEFHAYLVVDYSRNGVSVNGVRVKGYQQLHDGDKILVPGCLMHYFLLAGERTGIDPRATMPEA